VLASGTAAQVRAVPQARALLAPPLPGRATAARARPTGWMTVRKPTENNLEGEDVRIPLGVLTGICGVSGSGKSSLAIDVLARALAPKKLTTSAAATPVAPGGHERIDGAPQQVRNADQSSVGITSPGAFLKVLGPLRDAYLDSAPARERAVAAADLQPRCDGCKGKGTVTEDMGFMPSVQRPCDACEATGYRAEARELAVRGHTLPELERLSIEEVLELWEDHEAVAAPLRAAVRLGLGYLNLGQGPGSLSGGERQRLKLVREIAKPPARPALYILDEPTTGLHARDVAALVRALEGLVALGHSVLVVDHDIPLLACCDHLIELGPGGGPDGGRIVAEGTPEQLAAADTATAPYLREVLS
ncbi:excinuclease ABC subunit A, partial [Streptomyces sp. ScaeMP-e83]